MYMSKRRNGVGGTKTNSFFPVGVHVADEPPLGGMSLFTFKVLQPNWRGFMSIAQVSCHGRAKINNKK